MCALEVNPYIADDKCDIYIVVSLWDFVLVLLEMPMCKLHLHFHFSEIITSKHSMKLKFLGD